MESRQLRPLLLLPDLQHLLILLLLLLLKLLVEEQPLLLFKMLLLRMLTHQYCRHLTGTAGQALLIRFELTRVRDRRINPGAFPHGQTRHTGQAGQAPRFAALTLHAIYGLQLQRVARLPHGHELVEGVEGVTISSGTHRS